MRTVLAFAVTIVVVVVTTNADAADSKRRVLVADAVNNGADPNVVKTLTSMLVARLDARPGIDALSGAELRQLMSLQADKAACGSEDCVNDLTGALGAPLAVFSDVGALGKLVVVNLTLYDVVKGEPAGRASVETEKLEELPGKLDKAVDTLLAAERAAKVASASASTSSPAMPGGLLGGTGGDDVGAGGLGLRGTGPGGGGTSSGGLGLGTAPIGGSGKGHGYGSGAPAKTKGGVGAKDAAKESAPALEPASPPPPSPPPPPPPSGGGGGGGGVKTKAVDGEAPGLAAGDVQNVVKAHKAELKECGDLAKKHKKAGVVKVRFLIAADGKVTFAHVVQTELAGTGIPKCVIDKVATWTFPATGSPTTVVYPLKFASE